MTPGPPDAPKREYDVTEAPFDVAEQSNAQSGAIVEGQAEDEDVKRRNDAALASTYDPALAKSGKTDEEIDKQKHDEALAIGGAAIVAAVVVAHDREHTDDAPQDHGHETHHDAPGDDG